MQTRFSSGTALLFTLGLTAGAIAPLVTPAPAFAQVSFSDVSSNNWAAGFIQELATRDIIKGFPDGSFRPNEAVTRAQFAAMVSKAFKANPVRSTVSFIDVSSNYWAAQAIDNAYTTGFLAGYPGNVFRPGENIPRAQVLVSLANGLNYSSTVATTTALQVYSDADSIPNYARNSIAAATERRIVVNYPDLKFLQPNQVATRADVAAFIYQALASTGQVAAINSPYIVGQVPSPAAQITIPSGTTIPVRYAKAQKILLAANEKPTPITLTVAQNIVMANGDVLIPAGSEVAGQLVMVSGGAQFVARELTLTTGQKTTLEANSNVVTQTETIRKGASTGTILKDTVLGAAAAAGISAVTGDRAIATEEVLIGAGAGALAGVVFGGEKVELIAIKPNSDLNLQLSTDLVLPR
jgi:S-layer homology domain